MTVVAAMDGYLVPARIGDSLYEAKGSRFFGRAAPVESEEHVRALLGAMRAEHPDATHHAFTYRLGAAGEAARFSDDGEPGGTAGRPMMEVLLRESLVNAAVAVSRHFGGALLGAGGLVRAYGTAAAAAMRAAGTLTMRPHTIVRVEIDYSTLGAVCQEIRRLGLRAPTEEFGAMVTLTVAVPRDKVDAARTRLADISAGRARISDVDTVYLPEK